MAAKSRNLSKTYLKLFRFSSQFVHANIVDPDLGVGVAGGGSGRQMEKKVGLDQGVHLLLHQPAAEVVVQGVPVPLALGIWT